ncbi:hypothetical protein CEXT_725191 [Caerostris extrusa]|uniref:Uncharacterized protein n=1 Tax=Caerostris extrusa TaxID=172846 RepID=A0AAV4NP59_CAEEX|nr:hypothetical protein CEXT_725191 [Caerostris extrusa]
MFDSFKHDNAENRNVTSETAVESKIEVKVTPCTEGEAQSKDSKFNMKKMFDSFKHDSSEKKPDISIDAKSKEKNLSSSTSPKEIESTSKDSKSNISKMFGSFKQDPSEKKAYTS